MNKKKILAALFMYIVSISFLLSLPLAGNATATSAENAEGTADSTANEASFSFEVIFPENQIDTSIGYYNLHMEPGKQQTLQIRLNNPSTVEVTVEVSLNGAKTNSSGVIEYGPTDIENDASLKFPFEEVVSGPEEVVLAPGEEKMLEIEVKMPETSFDGYISGGIRLMRKGQAAEAGSMVVNQIAYMVGVLLSEQDADKIDAIEEDVQLNQVYPDIYNYRNAFMVNLSNVMPIYVDDVTAEVQIMQAGSDQVLYDTKKSQMRMAPNVMMDFPVTLNGEEIVAGDYLAKVVVTSGKGGRWEWEHAFTVTDEEAEKLNGQDLSLVQDPGLNWQLIAMVAGAVLGGVLIIFLIIHFVRKKKGKNSSKKGKRKPSRDSAKKKAKK